MSFNIALGALLGDTSMESRTVRILKCPAGEIKEFLENFNGSNYKYSKHLEKKLITKLKFNKLFNYLKLLEFRALKLKFKNYI